MTARTVRRATGTVLGVAGVCAVEEMALLCAGTLIAMAVLSPAHSPTEFLLLWLAGVTAAGSLWMFARCLYRMLMEGTSR